eukprot:scaffold17808_cov33-Tisochrysis_lutea.AAC.5
MRLAESHAIHCALRVLLRACAWRPYILDILSSALQLPVLVPGVTLRVDGELECINEAGGADQIRVVLCSDKSALPVLSAIVNMPLSEALLNDV